MNAKQWYQRQILESGTETRREKEMAQLSSLSLPIPTLKPQLCSHHRHSQLLSVTRSSKPKLSARCQSSQNTTDSFPTFYPADSPVPSGLPPRVFVGRTIYKGQAALNVEPIAPEFTSLNTGAFKISREGFVLLQFAHAVGPRAYDWNKKQIFSLSVSELGTLISLAGKDSCEFYHDPLIGRSDEGQISKILKVEPFPDGPGYFFDISVQNKLANVDDSISVPVTKGEYTVLMSAFNFILPYLMGWHTFANNTGPENAGPVNSSRSGGYSEWSR